MSKGQKRGNREVKKPKAPVEKPVAGTVASQYQLPAMVAAAKERERQATAADGHTGRTHRGARP